MKRLLSFFGIMAALATDAAAQQVAQQSADPQVQIYRQLLDQTNAQLVQTAASAQTQLQALQKQVADLQRQMTEDKAKAPECPARSFEPAAK